jgi:hypothetical protein
MNKEENESSEDNSAINILESYTEAAEMYATVFKLVDTKASLSYIYSSKAINFTKAFISFCYTDNLNAIMGSRQEALSALTESILYVESNVNGKNYAETAKIIIEHIKELTFH